MHEMQTILPMFAVSIRQSVRLSVCRATQLCGAFVQPLSNYFGLLFLLHTDRQQLGLYPLHY